MTAPAVAVWRQGQWRVTVTSDGGGEWVYDVIGGVDRPSQGWFAGTPWAIFPGGEWEERDGTTEPAVWTVAVFPVSAAAAADLGIDWPPGPGSLTAR